MNWISLQTRDLARPDGFVISSFDKDQFWEKKRNEIGFPMASGLIVGLMN